MSDYGYGARPDHARPSPAEIEDMYIARDGRSPLDPPVEVEAPAVAYGAWESWRGGRSARAMPYNFEAASDEAANAHMIARFAASPSLERAQLWRGGKIIANLDADEMRAAWPYDTGRLHGRAYLIRVVSIVSPVVDQIGGEAAFSIIDNGVAAAVEMPESAYRDGFLDAMLFRERAPI
jgi:hypothetical protein